MAQPSSRLDLEFGDDFLASCLVNICSKGMDGVNSEGELGDFTFGVVLGVVVRVKDGGSIFLSIRISEGELNRLNRDLMNWEIELETFVAKLMYNQDINKEIASITIIFKTMKTKDEATTSISNISCDI